MKNLLYKELKLVVVPGTYFFALCGALLLVPAYPYFVGVSYCIMSFLISFAAAQANKDHEFTAMLPIPRDQIVLAKHLTVVFVELLTLAVAVPCAFITSLVLNPGGNIVGMDANFAFFGLTLIEYSVFNIVFLPGYFKTGYKTGFPMLFGLISYVSVAVIFEVLIAVIPVLKTNLDSLNPATFGYQFIVLGLGIIAFLITTFVSWKVSTKKFEKVSL
ncbi:MAG: ABC-2 transporter permease [Firmicutes bacterium]|nr:ABC-2 transporter permease [Bacillota bacterium]